MLSRIIPETATMILWAIFFMFSAVYMGALEPLEAGKRGWHALTKAIGVLFMIYGALLFSGALSGSTSMFTPLDQFTNKSTTVVQGAAATSNSSTKWNMIHSNAELDAILAANRDKTVMLDFSAEWCSSCIEMEHITFADAGVNAKMSEFVLVQADVTANSDDERALTKRFGLFGPPGILFFKDAQEIKKARVIGYQPPEKFLAHLNKV